MMILKSCFCKLRKRSQHLVKSLQRHSKTFCIALSDFQIGKEGTEQTIERWMDSIPKIKEQIKRLES